MPILTTTIEDTSPMIIYSGSSGSDWIAGTSADPLADLYSQSSFTVTYTANADMSFYFYGTSVTLYGAKRLNHGAYQVSVDSVVYPAVNGSVPDPGTFQTPLFSATDLANGYHTVRMANLESRYLDLDFITLQIPVGQANEALIVTTVQDTDSSFKYIPEQQWSTTPTNLGLFSGGSGHVTSTPGASLEYTFKVINYHSSIVVIAYQLLGRASSGDSVALYGPVGPSGAPFSVQLDNKDAQDFSSNKQFYRPQMILFQASNLGGGQHTVKLTSEAWGNSSLSLAVDYAQVYTTPSLQKSSGSSGSSGLSTGAIVGISIGAVLLALLAFIVIFRRLWPSITVYLKRTSNQNQQMQAFEHPISVNEPTSGPGLTTAHAYNPVPPPLSSVSGGMSNTLSMSSDALPTGTTTQMATIPYTPEGKYRPDLVSVPQNMWSPSQGHTRLDSTTTQTQSTLQSPSSSATGHHQQPQLSYQQRGPVNGETETVPPPRYEVDPS